MLLFSKGIDESVWNGMRIYCLLTKHDLFEKILVKIHIIIVYCISLEPSTKHDRIVYPFSCQERWMHSVFAVPPVRRCLKNDFELSKQIKRSIGFIEYQNVSLKLSCLFKVLFALKCTRCVFNNRCNSMQTQTGIICCGKYERVEIVINILLRQSFHHFVIGGKWFLCRYFKNDLPNKSQLHFASNIQFR